MLRIVGRDHREFISKKYISICKTPFEKSKTKSESLLFKADKKILNFLLKCCSCRNFPQGSMSDMIKDASQGISFVFNNIAEYGGDPKR